MALFVFIVPIVHTLITSLPMLLKYEVTALSMRLRFNDSVSKSILYTLGYPIFIRGVDYIITHFCGATFSNGCHLHPNYFIETINYLDIFDSRYTYSFDRTNVARDFPIYSTIYRMLTVSTLWHTC